MSRGDLTITVGKAKLLGALDHNRAKHLAAYEKAVKGWHRLLERELNAKLSELKGQKTRAPRSEKNLGHIANQRPQHYLGYYDQAIEMLSFGVDVQIELTAEQFQQYVKDQWNWSGTFTSSNSAYVRVGAKS